MSNDQARRLWEDLREQVANGKSDFSNTRFPEDPSLKGFNGLTFTREACFRNAVFEGVAYYRDVTFENAAIFEGAVFEKEACFRNAAFAGCAIFSAAEFKGHSDFVEVTWGSDALFNDAHIANGVFYDSRFRDVAQFRGTHFGEATFHRVVFEHYARFSGARFVRQANFPGAIFMRTATFEECLFEGTADFCDARAIETLVFPLPKRDRDGPRPFRQPEQGETAYRSAKRSAINTGDSLAASAYHYAERCAIEKRMRASWRLGHLPLRTKVRQILSGWAAFALLRVPFGYGEKPLRVLVTCLAVIAGFAVCYWMSGNVDSDQSNTLTLLDALYFSAVTFTTLGYGDYQPVSIARILASGEAFLGALLMAVFVVVLCRRYVR